MKIVLNNDDGSLFAKLRAAEFTPTFWWRDAKRRYFAGHRTLVNGDAGRHHVYSSLCLRAVFSYTDAARGLLHYPSRSWRTCDTAPEVGTPRATELENKLKPKSDEMFPGDISRFRVKSTCKSTWKFSTIFAVFVKDISKTI